MNTRIAIAVEESGNEERVAGHFGTTSKFNVFEFDEQKKIISTEAFFNPLAGEHTGACQLPGYVKQFNVNVIIAGGMGQKAASNFLSLGIEVVTASGLLVQDALAKYLGGELTGYEVCSLHHHHGHEHNCS